VRLFLERWVFMFGDRLKNLRKESDLSQEELGKKFNVHKGTISKWENRINFPDEIILMKLSDLFGVTLDYLLGKSDKRQPHHLTKEDIVRIAPEHAWLFEEEGLGYVELVEEIRSKEIPLEPIKELVDTILKYRHLNK